MNLKALFWNLPRNRIYLKDIKDIRCPGRDFKRFTSQRLSWKICLVRELVGSRYQGVTITLRHTTFGMTPLDE